MTYSKGPWWQQYEASRNGRWIKSADGQDVAQILLVNPTNETNDNANLIKRAPIMHDILIRLAAIDTEAPGAPMAHTRAAHDFWKELERLVNDAREVLK